LLLLPSFSIDIFVGLTTEDFKQQFLARFVLEEYLEEKRDLRETVDLLKP